MSILIDFICSENEEFLRLHCLLDKRSNLRRILCSSLINENNCSYVTLIGPVLEELGKDDGAVLSWFFYIIVCVCGQLNTLLLQTLKVEPQQLMSRRLMCFHV